MLVTSLLKVGVCAFCIGLIGCERDVSFAGDVQPILLASCVECHDSLPRAMPRVALASRTTTVS